MNQLQKWFDKVAGVTQEERARYEFAREVFCTQPIDVVVLQTPACWRRKARPVLEQLR